MRSFYSKQCKYFNRDVIGYKKRNWFSNENTLKIKFNIYQEDNRIKQFVIDNKSNFSDIESLIKSDNGKIKEVAFAQGLNNLIPVKQQGFVAAAAQNRIQLFIDGKQHAYDFDHNGAIMYNLNTVFDQKLAENQVPYMDSVLIAQFIQFFQENLKEYSTTRSLGKSDYTREEVKKVLKKSLQEFPQQNDQKIKELVQELAVINMEDEAETQELQQIQVKSVVDSKKIVQLLIALAVAQWGGLFYITYFMYGWDVGEPISYLLALSVESLALFMYLRHNQGISAKNFFGSQMLRTQENLLKQRSTNPAVEHSLIQYRQFIQELRIKALNEKTPSN